MSELVFIMSPPFLGVMQTVPARRLLVGNANIRAETMHLLDHHHPTIHSESRMSLFQITVFSHQIFFENLPESTSYLRCDSPGGDTIIRVTLDNRAGASRN